MMANSAVRPKPAGSPELVFRWRPVKPQWLPKLIALAFAGVALALLMTVRIRVIAPEKTSPRRAALVYLRDDAEGRAMSLRAQEGGPFPARFQLSQWEGLTELEGNAMETARIQPEPYVSPIRELPAANQLQPLELAAKGESFFPQRAPASADAPAPANLKLAPSLYPLAGVSHETLPLDLPPFDGAVDAEMASSSWRFLVRLNPDGGVAECVSLVEKVGEARAPELEVWLHRIQFKPEPGQPFRWIAVGVGFTNQPADGTDAR
jgi:hypothetical protein